MSTDIETRAERKVLGALAQKPNLFFDTTAVLGCNDFSDPTCRSIYKAIENIASEGTVNEKEVAIDETILEQRVASLFPEGYKRDAELIRDTIIEVTTEEPISIRDFKGTVLGVIRNSVARQADDVLKRIQLEVPLIPDHKDIVSFIESEIFGFTTGLQQSDDIVVLGSDYDRFMAQRAVEYEKGTLRIGIDTGFPRYNEAIGGGFRDGTINVVAARSKMGKSWFGLQIADNVARQDIPVLYLDTELENNYQTDRRCAQGTGIPINLLETYEFSRIPKYVAAVDGAKENFKKYPIFYVDVKGWSIDRIISVIRKFFAKHVKRRPDGKYNRALVIYDYVKLMSSKEKGRDAEWETLGYRMTLLHDLMGSYNNPMLALAQQNRDGLEKEDESTISGSDRIIWLCDNFSLLIKISPEEIASQQAQVDSGEVVPIDDNQEKPIVYNVKLKVVVCRHGPGTRNGYIATYMDIHDGKLRHDEVSGRIKEGPRRIIQRQSEESKSKA